jgi:hypothetical protein
MTSRLSGVERWYHLRVRVAPEQGAALREVARQERLSISHWLRSLVARELASADAALGSAPDESAIREMAILVAVELVLKLQEASIPGGTTLSRRLLEDCPRGHLAAGTRRGQVAQGRRAMRSKTSILALEWMPVSVAGGVRKALGGFLRYVEFRDQHLEGDPHGGLDAYVRYVAHRDRTSAAGRIFGRDGVLSDADRHRLVDFVARSTKGLQPRWQRNRDGDLEDHQRAVYQMILSPEDWRGLDLRRMARAAMQQLEADAGEKGIGPWFAAEHRNTEHHHVHIVLAARREVEAGKFSTLLITRKRLQRMKEAIALEIDRQRGLEREPETAVRELRSPVRLEMVDREQQLTSRWNWLQLPARRLRARVASRHRGGHRPIAATLLHLRGVALRYHHDMERELEQELVATEREGWLR